MPTIIKMSSASAMIPATATKAVRFGPGQQPKEEFFAKRLSVVRIGEHHKTPVLPYVKCEKGAETRIVAAMQVETT